ncbi:MAG: aminoglycoside/choline kinase family phosphotransferase [Verrucomicrobiales bacterium]|jgi:aminoglycoside/choline kinase family phosphotransferase
MDSADIIRETRLCVASMAEGQISVEPINKGGSDRSYARLNCEGAAPLVFMAYTDARPDNAAFLGVSDFLARSGVHVPAIVGKNLDRKFLWIEDLGSDDLWAHRDDAWPERRDLYRKTMIEVAKLHRMDSATIDLQPAFDEALYLWEQEYFVEQYLRRFSDGAVDDLLGGAELTALRQELAAMPRFLVHRDFQSENVMVRDGEVFLIDYQGLRLGRPEYDVASLLYDPYVGISDAERGELLRMYFEIAELNVDYDEWLGVFYRCAAQRLMQAMGAYGFLGVGKGRVDFLKHIPVARERLDEVLGTLGLERVRAALASTA